MITAWLMGLAVGIVEWFTSLMTGWVPPDWFVDLGDTVNSFTATLDGLGVWVNWYVVGACVTAVLASWQLFGKVKLTRVAASHVPQFGGGG